MSLPRYSVVGTVIVSFPGHNSLFIDDVCCVVTIEGSLVLAFNVVSITINNDKR